MGLPKWQRSTFREVASPIARNPVSHSGTFALSQEIHSRCQDLSTWDWKWRLFEDRYNQGWRIPHIIPPVSRFLKQRSLCSRKPDAVLFSVLGLPGCSPWHGGFNPALLWVGHSSRWLFKWHAVSCSPACVKLISQGFSFDDTNSTKDNQGMRRSAFVFVPLGCTDLFSIGWKMNFSERREDTILEREMNAA